MLVGLMIKLSYSSYLCKLQRQSVAQVSQNCQWLEEAGHSQ